MKYNTFSILTNSLPTPVCAKICHIVYVLAQTEKLSLRYNIVIFDENKKPIAQIDMIIDRRDNAINLCEIKFVKQEYAMNKEEFDKMNKKKWALSALLNPQQYIMPTMITTFGCERTGHYLSLITNEVDMNALFMKSERMY